MAENPSEKEFYGPLYPLIGVWQGDRGMDVSAEREGEEMSPYSEIMTILPVGDATNAEEQILVALSYTQIVTKKSTGQVFHHQTGYWYFEKATGEVLYSLAIPRAVSVLAKGKAVVTGNRTEISVHAEAADKNYGIIESTFMATKASTRAFDMKVTIDGDTLSYSMNTLIDIYSKKNFAHTDENTLNRK